MVLNVLLGCVTDKSGDSVRNLTYQSVNVVLGCQAICVGHLNGSNLRIDIILGGITVSGRDYDFLKPFINIICHFLFCNKTVNRGD